MRKILLISALLTASVLAVVFLISHTRNSVEVKEAGNIGLEGTGAFRPSSPAEEFPASEWETGDEPPALDMEDSPAGDAAPGAGFDTVSIPAAPEETVAIVNNIPITVGELFPPGVMLPGDELPEGTFQKFLDRAIEQRLMVQEAQKLGLADDPGYIEAMEDMRKDLEEISQLSEEQIEWRMNHFAQMALVQDLYRMEGLLPQKVSKEEIENYYREHGDEYEWVRKRERLQDRSPEKIERKVKDEIKRDLKAPLKKDITEKRKAYTDKLREKANIEILR